MSDPIPQDALDPAAPPASGSGSAAARERALADLLLSEQGGEWNAFPLSFAQQRLWFLSLLAPASPAYIIPIVLALRGAVDRGALAGALVALVARHEVLRTRFEAVGGRPIQWVVEPPAVPLPEIDLAGLPAPRSAGRALAVAFARQPFDLARAPLLRAALLRLGAGEHWLLVAVHHIVFDGWSIAIFWRELAELYAAAVAGWPARLPPLAIQYADYAVWQREWFTGAVVEEQIAWWRQALGDRAGGPAGGGPPAGLARLELPYDAPGAAGESEAAEAAGGEGARRWHVIAAPATAAAAAAGRAAGATLFMTLVAAFAALLHRYTGETRIPIGTPLANRGQSEVEPLIGCFINTVVLAVALGGSPSFGELLRRVRETAVGAFAHGELPFELVVEALRPDRAGGAPLFQVLFALQSAPRPPAGAPGLAVELLPIDNGTAKFDLHVEAWEEAGGVTLAAEYDARRFEAATVVRLLGHYSTLLAAAAAEPRAPLERLPLLPAAERHQVVCEWGEAAAPGARGDTLVALFAAAVARRGDAPAVVCGAASLTYRQLDGAAERLAARLRRLGVGPEVVVGIAAERSLALPVGLLGILKAGGAYLPLDPSYPPVRLAAMLAEARRGGAPCLVVVPAAAPSGLALLPPGAARLVPLELSDTGSGEGAGAGAGGGAGAGRESGEAPAGTAGPAPAVDPANLAYVLFTSGSTGVPKGVAVPHRAVVRLVRDTGYARFAADEVFLHVSPLGFDASTFEIWGALTAGARLVVAPPGAPSLAELGRIIRDGGVTALWLTAGLFQQMAEAQLGDLAGVRQLLAGGDVLPREACARVLAALPATRLTNGYGPTENTTFTCCHAVAALAPGRPVPIGRPIAGTRVVVLDGRGEPVPAGVAGELFAGGDGLARGYFARPGLTAERFVPDGSARRGGGGERLYATGDRVRWRPDGTLEFLGRLDRQVKVRGFRVEPAEIEAALAAHPAVREAAVAVSAGDGAAARRLIAFTVAGPAGAASPAELRAFLLRRLPAHLMPNAFVALAALPLSPNGKLDRAGLLAAAGPAVSLGGAAANPGNSASTAARPSRPPAGPLEELLADLFAAVLGSAGAGADDDFFALGGHSLLATQLVSRVRSVLGVELPLAAFFARPTVAATAAAVAAARGGPGTAPIPRLARDAAPLAVSFAQERIWFLQQLEPLGHAYNLPAALGLVGDLDPRALGASFARVIARHEILRTRYGVAAGRPVQHIVEVGDVTFRLPRIDLGALPAARREAAGRAVHGRLAALPFDLAADLPLRAWLVGLGEGRYLLVLSLHHIAGDAWSVDILLGELTAFYARATAPPRRRRAGAAMEKGAALDLPAALPIQYADFAAWQRRWLAGPALAEQLGWWRRQLAGADPSGSDSGTGAAAAGSGRDLPADFRRPERQRFAGAGERLALDADLAARLRSLGRAEGATLFMTLLAAFGLLAARLTGAAAALVGAPIAGRTRAECEPLIGCFLNTLALPVEVAGEGGFAGLLGRVREAVIGAFMHQELPFERLVEELRPRRDLGRNPLFDLLLNLINTPRGEVRLERLTLAPAAPPPVDAKFAMTLYAQETADGGVALHLVYQRALFAPPRIRLFLDQLRHLLAQAVAAPGMALDSLSLVSPACRELLPDPAAPLAAPAFAPVVETFLDTASAAPDAPALRQGERQLTYGELARAAAGVARRLRSAGSERGTVVAVAGRRGFALIAAVLGVFGSGGVLLLLDPRLPEERRRLMLREAGARFLLAPDEDAVGPPDGALTASPDPRPPGVGAAESTVGDLAAAAAVQRLAGAGALESAMADVAKGLPVQRLPGAGGPGSAMADLAAAAAELRAARPQDAAYVFFTSGTTGAPKAVLGRHAGLAHFLDWQRRTFAAGPGDRSSQLTGLSFDVVLREVLLPLLAGATLCLPAAAEADELAADRVLPWLAAERITLLHTVPALARLWLSRVPPGLTLPHLRWVFFAGEPLPDTLVERWRERFPPAGGIANLYGPTETTLAKCCFVVPAAPPPGVQPVGRPLPDTQALVLAGERLCGVGEPGEIALRTPFRTLGYANDAALTGARFVPNPWRDDAADLLYRSGDLGRYRPDGALEILGRLDDQVKVRGVRVEPAEVRAALETHPAVRDAEVGARPDPAGGLRLVAWYVAAAAEQDAGAGSTAAAGSGVAAEPPSAGELRRYLAARLPEAAVPGAFVRLDALPLTANGKVDRARLPDPGAERPELAAPYVAAASAAEHWIGEVWRAVLGLEQVGVDDNFFDLGGHSLLLVEVQARLEERLGAKLPLVELFRHPTVAALARHLDERAAAAPPRHEAGRQGIDRAAARRAAAARRRGDGA